MMITFQQFLGFVIGDRITIRRSRYCGAFSGIPAALIMVVTYAVSENTFAPVPSLFSNLSGTHWYYFYFFYIGACFSMALMAMAGQVVGWSLIRPLAALLRFSCPSKQTSTIWAYSSAVVWWVIVTISSYSPNNVANSSTWLVLVIASLLTLLICGLGGRFGAGVPIEPSQDSRELAVTGGMVTSSLLIGMGVLTSMLPQEGSPSSTVPNHPVLTFFVLALFALVLYLPYLVIVPTANLLLKTKRCGAPLPNVFVGTSTIVWLSIGILLFNALLQSVPLIGLSLIGGLALSGAIGGWAISVVSGTDCQVAG